MDDDKRKEDGGRMGMVVGLLFVALGCCFMVPMNNKRAGWNMEYWGYIDIGGWHVGTHDTKHGDGT